MVETALKICGLTLPEDVSLCNALGVDFTGFVFADGSPRRVTVAQAAAMPKGKARRVGVFTDASPENVAAVCREASLDFAQLHGGQDETFCRILGPEKIIKVFWPEKQARAELQKQLTIFAPLCAYFLFDAGVHGGGGGRPFTWDLLRHMEIPRPWFLAGGIGPDNAREAILFCRSFALDVNSGVEMASGVKDAAKIIQIMQRIASISND